MLSPCTDPKTLRICKLWIEDSLRAEYAQARREKRRVYPTVIANLANELDDIDWLLDGGGGRQVPLCNWQKALRLHPDPCPECERIRLTHTHIWR